MIILNMRTKITFHRNEINIAKVCLVKSIGGLHCELLLIAPFLFFKFLYKPVYDFSRKSLSKYLMNTIDKTTS